MWKLARHPGVRNVALFGKFAERLEGDVLDVALVTDAARARKFFKLIKEHGGYNAPRAVRWAATVEVLGNDLVDRLKDASDIVGKQLNLFVFPPEWRLELEKLKGVVTRDDFHFMQYAAENAILYRS